MKKLKQLLALLFVALLFLTAPSTPALALGGPYHPPALSFVVYGAPKDLQIVLHIIREEGSCTVTLEPERRAWETYFRFYREAAWEINRWYGNAYDLQDTEIELRSGGQSRFLPMPRELVSERGLNDILSLSYRSGAIRRGLPLWRAPLLIGMRVAVLLAIKALIFWLYDYRMRKSWLIFLLVNLVTLTVQAAFPNGWINVDPNYYPVFFLLCFLMVIVELVVLLLLVDEQSRDRMATYTIWGNVAGEIANAALFSFLPL